jgi:hypothetical protein
MLNKEELEVFKKLMLWATAMRSHIRDVSQAHVDLLQVLVDAEAILDRNEK